MFFIFGIIPVFTGFASCPHRKSRCRVAVPPKPPPLHGNTPSPTGWQLPILLLLAVFITLLVFQQVRSVALAVSPADQRIVVNAYEPEPDLDGSGFVRWTTAATRLDLPLVAAHTPLIASVTVINSYPEGVPDPTLRITAGTTSVRSSVPREAGQPRTYSLLVSPSNQWGQWSQWGWALPITLESSTYQPAARIPVRWA